MSEFGENPSLPTGTMDIQSGSSTLAGTLDEPVSVTLKRDLNKIAQKIKFVMNPNGQQEETLKELRNWDLWGPLLLCLQLSIMLSLSAPPSQEMVIFASVFFIFWSGSGVVTLNCQLLGGKISFFQSVCVLGYCIFPLNVASVLCFFVSNWLFRAIIGTLCYIWSTRASVMFMGAMVDKERRMLAVYPVFLFYICIAWMIVIE
jgi:hypothetical protein